MANDWLHVRETHGSPCRHLVSAATVMPGGFRPEECVYLADRGYSEALGNGGLPSGLW